MKKPNVSGQFYSSNKDELKNQINQFLSKADIDPKEEYVPAIIVPHAGYVYSGQVAAYGFKAASKNTYKTIVIIAASHYFPFDGVSIYSEGAFSTPLGDVEVDDVFAKELILLDNKFSFESQVFEQEHSLEVEIPFAQSTFKDFKIVPIIMGQPTFDVVNKFAQALNKVIGDREDVLVIASTDMSHFHNDSVARDMDNKTLDVLREFDIEEFWKGCKLKTLEMCGFVPVTAALLYAKQKGFKDIEILKYANSGDITQDKSRVVGYTSAIIYNKETVSKKADLNIASQEVSILSEEQKKRLLQIARETVEEYVRTGRVKKFKEIDKRLHEEEGAFVTIHKGGVLRGCIGNILGRGPLYLTIRDMAISSCSRDSRFNSVSIEELDKLDVEVSVLSKPIRVKSVDEIILGKHGVIVSRGPFNQGVFLPQVADETQWSKDEFLSQLCSQKAGLSRDCWKDPGTRMDIFTAEVFSENELE
ncbi:MAG: AmmeMemoRadiSam system protein B [Candidatus Zapsychrus exili]|nr:AmmeMemoRadiSam system protein B [Candidatus Zapsychrus exili]